MAKLITIKVKKVTLYKATTMLRENEVPEDMLRYDHAYVCDKLPGIVAFVDDSSRKAIPTVDRWSSFRWGLEELATVKGIDPSEWYTFHHDGGITMNPLVRLYMKDEKRWVSGRGMVSVTWDFSKSKGSEEIPEDVILAPQD